MIQLLSKSKNRGAKSMTEKTLPTNAKKEDYFTFIHVADSHNGYSGNSSRYNEYSALRIEKSTDRGINVRQDDIDQRFKEVMDIAIERKVDAVLHAGDGTDAWGYKQPYVFNFYTSQVTRLHEHGIDYVEIVGNHNLPKKIGVGCYLESLGRYPGVHTVYKGFYEQLNFPKHNVTLHCVPSTFTQEILNESLDEVEKVEGTINIGIGHFGVSTIDFYIENAEKTLVTSLDKLVKTQLDYWALGDYHKRVHFGNNIHYSGPIERLGFGESDITPQILLVHIHKTTQEVFVEEITLKARPMLDLEVIDAENKSIDEINSLIENTLVSHNLQDAIVRLSVHKLPKHYKSALEIEKIKELTEESLYFKLDLKGKTEKTASSKTAQHVKFEGVLEGWRPFMDAVENDGTFDKDKVTNEGYERLADALELQ